MSPAAMRDRPFAADARRHLARGVDQGLLVAGVVLQPFLARRQQAERGDAQALLVIDRGGEAVGETSGRAIAGVETLEARLRHFLEEGALAEALAVGQDEIVVGDQLQDRLVVEMRDQHPARGGPGQRHRLADIGADAEVPLALLHLGDDIFAIVEHAQLRRLAGHLREMIEETGGQAHHVEMREVRQAKQVEPPAQEHAALGIGAVEDAAAQHQAHDVVGGGLGRADGDCDLVGPERLLRIVQAFQDLEGTVDAAGAAAGIRRLGRLDDLGRFPHRDDAPSDCFLWRLLCLGHAHRSFRISSSSGTPPAAGISACGTVPRAVPLPRSGPGS